MYNGSSIQIRFFEALKDIQETSVLIAQNEKVEQRTVENMLYSATYNAICGIMEIIDGYYSEDLQLDLIERESKKSIKKPNTELHDICEDYLRYE